MFFSGIAPRELVEKTVLRTNLMLALRNYPVAFLKAFATKGLFMKFQSFHTSIDVA